MRRCHRNATASRDRGDFANESALANAGWSYDIDNAPSSVHRLVENCRDGIEFPFPADESRLAATPWLLVGDRQQPARSDRVTSALDLDHLGSPQHHPIL